MPHVMYYEKPTSDLLAWTPVGSQLILPGINATVRDIKRFSSNRIVASYLTVNDTRRVGVFEYDDGTGIWTQIGNELTFNKGPFNNNAVSICVLIENSRILVAQNDPIGLIGSTLTIYDFDGVNWLQVGVPTESLSFQSQYIDTLDATSIAMYSTNVPPPAVTARKVRRYTRIGGLWVFSGAEKTIANSGTQISGITSLDTDNVAIVYSDTTFGGPVNQNHFTQKLNFTGAIWNEIGNATQTGLAISGTNWEFITATTPDTVVPVMAQNSLRSFDFIPPDWALSSDIPVPPYPVGVRPRAITSLTPTRLAGIGQNTGPNELFFQTFELLPI